MCRLDLDSHRCSSGWGAQRQLAQSGRAAACRPSPAVAVAPHVRRPPHSLPHNALAPAHRPGTGGEHSPVRNQHAVLAQRREPSQRGRGKGVARRQGGLQEAGGAHRAAVAGNALTRPLPLLLLRAPAWWGRPRCRVGRPPRWHLAIPCLAPAPLLLDAPCLLSLCSKPASRAHSQTPFTPFHLLTASRSRRKGSPPVTHSVGCKGC